MRYHHRLREDRRLCKFEKIGFQDLTIDNELIQIHLIEGTADIIHKYNIVK